MNAESGPFTMSWPTFWGALPLLICQIAFFWALRSKSPATRQNCLRISFGFGALECTMIFTVLVLHFAFAVKLTFVEFDCWELALAVPATMAAFASMRRPTF